MLTELQAVNEMLGTIRESPVSTLDGTLTEEAAIALQILRKTSEDVQERGWWFNTDTDVTLTRDVNGKITMSDNPLRLIPTAYDAIQAGPVLRGSVVWDSINGTDVWTRDLTGLTVIRSLGWASLPRPAANYIALRAARLLAKRVHADPATVQEAGFEEARAWDALVQADLAATRPNALLAPGIIDAAFRGYGV